LPADIGYWKKVLCGGGMMQKQLHLRFIDELDFSKVSREFYEPDCTTDRIGGFWTSTYREDIGCEWLHYKMYKPYAHLYTGYVFNIMPDTTIYTINSRESEDVFNGKYKEDYNLLSKDYDCIHIDSNYVEHLRNTRSTSRFLHWTCDCTWWFNTDKLILDSILTKEQITSFASIPYKGSIV
jgi:hypothetical protein